MDAELTALAASGATTLVSLMATDAWAQARDLVSRFLVREGSPPAALANLDEARSRLLVTTDCPEDERPRIAVRTECQSHLEHLTATGCTVHNKVDGGVHHAPIIQSGRISGLTLHVHRPAPGPGEQQS